MAIVVTGLAAPLTAVTGRVRALIWPVFFTFISPHVLILPEIRPLRLSRPWSLPDRDLV